jgi:hypothetical protein
MPRRDKHASLFTGLTQGWQLEKVRFASCNQNFLEGTNFDVTGSLYRKTFYSCN